MTTELWEAHSSIMDKAKYPFWTYLGSASIIIIFLTSIGILFSIKPPHNQSSFNQTLNPIKNVGNVIVVKENPYYTSFQITKIETESITLIPNKFSYRNNTSLDIVKERDFLNKKPFKIGVDSINTSIKGYKVIKVVILN